MAFRGSVPVPFPGTREEAKENFKSHSFSNDPDSRCYFCDSRPSYESATYPCGDEVPRMEVEW